MSTHPLNLTLRFLLELCALIITGIWGWQTGEGINQYFFALLIPGAMAAIWGIFAVPDDPSRSGKTVVKTNGLVRLILELLVFTAGGLAFYGLNLKTPGVIYSALVIIHYVTSYDRVIWLITKAK